MILFKDLTKIYRSGFIPKKVTALENLNLEVKKGEIFGYLGPNGAGKTTTIKLLMNLIFPSGGTASINGIDISDKKARAKVGFLPDFPYFYEYLNGYEYLDYTAKLFGIEKAKRAEKIESLITLVKLNGSEYLQLRKYSRGMLQRIGLASCLINDPDLLILDEPLSGLDPIGRIEFKNIIKEQKEKGKTIFFSSHILSDAEKICDRVCFISRGKLVSLGTLDGMLNREVLSTEIECSQEKVDFNIIEDSFNKFEIVKSDIKFRLILPQDVNLNIVLKRLIELGVQIESVLPSKETLEDVFIKKMNI